MTGTVTVTTPTAEQIVLTRTFAASSRRVFDAHTRPELLRRWHGARGWHLVECEVDLRVGGAWRFVSRGPDGAEMGMGGVYREIVASQRLVHTERYDDQWFPGEALACLELAEHAGAARPTTTLTTTLTFPSREVRDLVLRSPMERGLTESYDRLAAALRSPEEEEQE